MHSREMKTYACTETCKQTLIAALFLIANLWKRPEYPSNGEWKNEMRDSHILEVDSHSTVEDRVAVKKKNEVLIHAATWMKPGNVLRERNRSTRTTYYMTPFI